MWAMFTISVNSLGKRTFGRFHCITCCSWTFPMGNEWSTNSPSVSEKLLALPGWVVGLHNGLPSGSGHLSGDCGVEVSFLSDISPQIERLFHLSISWVYIIYSRPTGYWNVACFLECLQQLCIYCRSMAIRKIWQCTSDDDQVDP